MIARVDAQPLLLLTSRLREAMETIGTPLPTEVQARIAGLSVEDDEETITAAIQEALDPGSVWQRWPFLRQVKSRLPLVSR